MSTHELILKWAGLLLQGQVLGFALALIAFLVWKREIAQLFEAISKKGGKFSAGPVSGEIGAGAQEGAMPINSDDSGSNEELSKSVLSEAAQWKVIQRLGLRFEDISLKGPSARSNFVDQIRLQYATGWSWNFLASLFENKTMYVRFCAAALLTTKGVNFEASKIANILARESSSLVRYRMIEALLYWSTSLSATLNQKKEVCDIVVSHVEENRYVADKLNELIRILQLNNR